MPGEMSPLVKTFASKSRVALVPFSEYDSCRERRTLESPRPRRSAARAPRRRPSGLAGTGRTPDRRTARRAGRHPHSHRVRGPCPPARRTGAGQDADGLHHRRIAGAQVRPHTVHAGPDAQRHHRHRDHRRRPDDRKARPPNRTPPKTQAALLQAMQEHEVTVAGDTHPLPRPFFVLATQNPIEQEGTYPLPEAQLDRFMLELAVPYPSRDEEERIVEETTGDEDHPVRTVIQANELMDMQHLVRRIPAPRLVVEAAVSLARMTRPGDASAPAAVREYVSW